MPRVRFYIDAEATPEAVGTIKNIEEIFLSLELENLTKLTATGSLSIDYISFENLED